MLSLEGNKNMLFLKETDVLGIVAYVCNPSTLEAEAAGSPQAQGLLGYKMRPCLKKKKEEEEIQMLLKPPNTCVLNEVVNEDPDFEQEITH